MAERMTYQTNNPVGSVDVRDLYDNAEAFDNFSAGPLDAYPDRFGVSRQSLAGIRAASSYQHLGDYGAGLEFTSYNQTFSYLGEFYAPSPSITLPYTTTGVGAGEIATFRSVGDAILRADLLADGGAGRVYDGPLSVAQSLAMIKSAGSVLASLTSTRDTPTVSQAETLQSAWDAAAAAGQTFVIDGIYWVATTNRTYSDGLVRPVGLQVPDNSVCVFTPGSAIKVIPNALGLAYVLNFYLADNFQIFNPTVYGDVDSHLSALDESFHCYNIVNCTNGYIFRPSAFNAWGDGIYIGTEYTGLTNKQLKNVTIFEPFVRHCGRNCIAITSGIDLNVYSPDVSDAFRTAPMAGIDIEPEGIGACKPVLVNVNIHGSTLVSDCIRGLAVFIYTATEGVVSVTCGDVRAKACQVPFQAQNWAYNYGEVKIGDIHVNGSTTNPVSLKWSSLNIHLSIGDVYAHNACSYTQEGVRYQSIVSVDIDDALQPGGEVGNFSVGDIYNSASGVNTVMTPFFFKDSTPAANRPLGNAKIGKCYGPTVLNYLHADGIVNSTFDFYYKSASSDQISLRRPLLYSELDIVASGTNHVFYVGVDYKTPIKITKVDLTSAPIKVYPPSGGQFYPLQKAAGGYLNTIAPGSSLQMQDLGGGNTRQTIITGTWTAP